MRLIPLFLLLLAMAGTLELGDALRAQTTQHVTLTGTVSDSVSQKAVEGADIILRDKSTPPKELAKVVSASNGKYIVSGLTAATQLVVVYQRGGYLPHPASVNFTLSAGANVKDLQLMANSHQTSYWELWAQKVNSHVNAATPNAAEREKLYNQFWSDLGASGFSPVAQALAARHLVEATPGTSHPRALMSFAAVDLDTLSKADSDIRAVVDGQSTAFHVHDVSPDVAVAIAASELKKTGSRGPQPGFLHNFEAVWGPGASGDLSKAVAISPTKDDYEKVQDRMHLMVDKPTS
jgi:hypothetical protein